MTQSDAVEALTRLIDQIKNEATLSVANELKDPDEDLNGFAYRRGLRRAITIAKDLLDDYDDLGGDAA